MLRLYHASIANVRILRLAPLIRFLLAGLAQRDSDGLLLFATLVHQGPNVFTHNAITLALLERHKTSYIGGMGGGATGAFRGMLAFGTGGGKGDGGGVPSPGAFVLL